MEYTLKTAVTNLSIIERVNVQVNTLFKFREGSSVNPFVILRI